MEYAIRKDDGELVLDSGWKCEADVISGFHGWAGRVYGALVVRDSPDAEWTTVRPSPTSKET
jgi:hypothetical protein